MASNPQRDRSATKSRARRFIFDRDGSCCGGRGGDDAAGGAGSEPRALSIHNATPCVNTPALWWPPCVQSPLSPSRSATPQLCLGRRFPRGARARGFGTTTALSPRPPTAARLSATEGTHWRRGAHGINTNRKHCWGMRGGGGGLAACIRWSHTAATPLHNSVVHLKELDYSPCPAGRCPSCDGAPTG